MTAVIQKWGNSQGIRIPKHILDAVHFSENESIEIVAEGEQIIIKSVAAKRKNIQELFADFDGVYVPVSVEWGQAKGNELW